MAGLHRAIPLGCLLLLLFGLAPGEAQPSPSPVEEPISYALASNRLELPTPVKSSKESSLSDYREQVAEKQQLNPDTIGWLYIPGTDINREVLQNPLEIRDNNYYLNIDFDGEPDKNGVYCADYRSTFGDREDLARNTVIYGHSWDDDPDGTLFSQLKRYREEDFARKHPYLYFSTEAEDMTFEVIAVFDATINFPYNMPNLSSATFFDVLDLVYESSLYHYSGSSIGPSDKFLTLSTCTFSVDGHEELPPVNGYRFAIMARLVEDGEPIKRRADLTRNPSPLSPDEAEERMETFYGYSFGDFFE